MDPRYFDEARYHGTGIKEASQSRGPGPQQWYDRGGELEMAVPFHEKAQMPSRGSELLSGHSPGPAVSPIWEIWRSKDADVLPGKKTSSSSTPIWEIWRSKDADVQLGKTSSSSTPTCHLCSERAGDSDSSESDSTTSSSDATGEPSQDSLLHLVGMTVLAVVLLSTVVAVNANMNRVIHATLDTAPPDATGQAQLVDSRRAGTDPGLPDSRLPALTRRQPVARGEGEDEDVTIFPPTEIDSEETAAETGGDVDDQRGESGASEVPPDLGDGSDITTTREDRKERSHRTQGKLNCQTVVYTYCAASPREFHYRASVNACLATSLDPVVQLCARGKNRFASLIDCEHSCMIRERPRDACFEAPIFTGCNRGDVKDSWWYHDGNRCNLWSFPSGTCPSNGSAVFATAAECAGRCAGHRGRQRYPPCGKPRAVPCERRHLRFPYFAHFSVPEGRTTCLRTSAAVVSGHRCLAGGNRFSSLADCKEACARKPL